MQKTEKPTTEQLDYLRSKGIDPPPTQATCRRLINYLQEGNNTRGKTQKDREELTKRYQQEWLRKRVRYTGPATKTGTVLCLFARNRSDVKILRDSHPDDHKKVHPFAAWVKWDNISRPSNASLSLLEKISPTSELAENISTQTSD